MLHWSNVTGWRRTTGVGVVPGGGWADLSEIGPGRGAAPAWLLRRGWVAETPVGEGDADRRQTNKSADAPTRN